MYKLNEPYPASFIAEEFFKVTPKSFSNNREKYLQHLSEYFSWTLTTKGKYMLLKELQPYETPKEKVSKEKRMEYYKEKTDTIIAEEPYNSGSNVARNIQVNNKYKVQDDTVARYVRKILRQFYISVDDRWSRPTEDGLHYVPLTEEELDYLKMLFTTKGNNELNYKYCAEYKAGNITRQEFLELLGDNVLNDYNEIITIFKEKYGYFPIKTKKYQSSPWENTPEQKRQ